MNTGKLNETLADIARSYPPTDWRMHYRPGSFDPMCPQMEACDVQRQNEVDDDE